MQGNMQGISNTETWGSDRDYRVRVRVCERTDGVRARHGFSLDEAGGTGGVLAFNSARARADYIAAVQADLVGRAPHDAWAIAALVLIRGVGAARDRARAQAGLRERGVSERAIARLDERARAYMERYWEATGVIP